MVAAVVQTLKDELHQLEGELRLDPRFVKIERIRALLCLYEPSLLTPQPQYVNGNGAAEHSFSLNSLGRKRPESKKAKVFAEVKRLLQEKGMVHRKDILAHLSQQGLMGGEKNPLGNLASYLNDGKELFRSDGLGKFSLRE